jgi:DNA-binding transcriptional regulator GbsR (MarR family)
MELAATTEKYILHWGEMGARWGVNRTVSQIHALLYLAGKPLCAEEIADTLNVARSNVSVSLRELQAWGLVRLAHVRGDRRDHFLALDDIWEIFKIIVEERRRREIDPTLTVLRECLLSPDPELDRKTRARMKEVLDFLELTTTWHQEIKLLPKPVVIAFLKLGGRIQKLLGKS